MFYLYVYIYIYMCMYVYIYIGISIMCIYIYIQRIVVGLCGSKGFWSVLLAGGYGYQSSDCSVGDYPSAIVVATGIENIGTAAMMMQRTQRLQYPLIEEYTLG